MKENLNLGERFTLLAILPAEGNFATLKVIRQLRESLSLTESEITEYGVKQAEDRITWNPENALKTKEIEFGDFAGEMIKAKLKKMDEDNKLEDKHFSLFEKFVIVTK
jgi:hypothetical protein